MIALCVDAKCDSLKLGQIYKVVDVNYNYGVAVQGGTRIYDFTQFIFYDEDLDKIGKANIIREFKKGKKNGNSRS